MIDRDPASIAKHCRKASIRSDLGSQERQMLAGYARFYEVLADGRSKDAPHEGSLSNKKPLRHD